MYLFVLAATMSEAGELAEEFDQAFADADMQMLADLMVVNNKLLGIIVGFLILGMICLALRGLYLLIAHNITKHF